MKSINLQLQRVEGGLRTLGRMKFSFSGHPLVTVITVVFNGEKHIEQTIKSVLDQSYTNIEYIIIDGESTDGTLEIIRRYADHIDHWVSEADEGIYDAMNKGVLMAHGELIALLNADDFFQPDAVLNVVAAYSDTPKACVIYGHTHIIQEDLGLDYIMLAHTDHWKGMGFTHSAMFVQREVYAKLGEYDKRYVLAADYDFLLRALENKVEMVFVDAVLNNYRNTGMSASNLSWALDEIRQISRKHFSFFSSAHIRFLILRYAKSMFILRLEKILGLLGTNNLRTIKRIYTKIFFAHGVKL